MAWVSPGSLQIAVILLKGIICRGLVNNKKPCKVCVCVHIRGWGYWRTVRFRGISMWKSWGCMCADLLTSSWGFRGYVAILTNVCRRTKRTCHVIKSFRLLFLLFSYYFVALRYNKAFFLALGIKYRGNYIGEINSLLILIFTLENNSLNPYTLL